MAKKRKPAADHAARIAELVEAADGLEHGPVKVGVLEEAVRLADAAGDVGAGYETRMDLIDAATFGGAPDVVLVAYAWCLARADRDPDRFDRFDLLWKYKWVVTTATDFPEISRERIAGLLADMGRRFEAAGSGPHPRRQKERDVALLMGDLAAARAAHAAVAKAPRTFLSDCTACEQDSHVRFYLQTGRPAVALRRAGPIVAGRVTCSHVPHRTYAKLLLPLLARGEAETAAEYHRKGFRLIGRNPEFVGKAGQHADFLTLTDNLSAAARALEKHLPNALATPSLADRFDLYKAAALFCDRVADAGRRLRLRVPDDAPRYPADRTDPAAARDWFLAECRGIAAAFDARNGNDWFARRLAGLPDLKKRVKPYPLSGG